MTLDTADSILKGFVFWVSVIYQLQSLSVECFIFSIRSVSSPSSPLLRRFSDVPFPGRRRAGMCDVSAETTAAFVFTLLASLSYLLSRCISKLVHVIHIDCSLGLNRKVGTQWGQEGLKMQKKTLGALLAQLLLGGISFSCDWQPVMELCFVMWGLRGVDERFYSLPVPCVWASQLILCSGMMSCLSWGQGDGNGLQGKIPELKTWQMWG